MRRLLVLTVALFVSLAFLSLMATSVTVDEERMRTEADYILSCQCTDKDSPAYGAINDVLGDPTWVVPSEVSMAGLGLLVAFENKYRRGAELAVEYLIRVQQKDGSWCGQYNGDKVVNYNKSPRQTAQVMYFLYKLGYSADRYEVMKDGTQYLMECQKVANKGGLDDGLLGGGKDANGFFQGWRWTHDNSWAYWGFKAAEFWADKKGEKSFSPLCAHYAERIIEGINKYLYNPNTGVWHIAVDGSGNPIKNPHLPCCAAPYESWIQYSPQMLDLPVEGVNSSRVGEWIHSAFQQQDGACAEWYCDGDDLVLRKYPGLSFQAYLCWRDIPGCSSYAESTISWVEQSELWILPHERKKIVDWSEIIPNYGATPEQWQAFVDTSALAIFSLSGGYDFAITPDLIMGVKEDKKGGCFISCFFRD